jgi:hypothetical protein
MDAFSFILVILVLRVTFAIIVLQLQNTSRLHFRSIASHDFVHCKMNEISAVMLVWLELRRDWSNYVAS